MDDIDLEGTRVLEQLAAVGRLDDFAEAVDADDRARATDLMRVAHVDEPTIAAVHEQMAAGDDG